MAESMSYQADAPYQQLDHDLEELCFFYTFPQKCTLLGCSRAVLWMSTQEHDDMDVFVQIRKADNMGKILHHENIPKEAWHAMGMNEVEPINPMIYLGPTGALRASYRELDDGLSDIFWPEHTYSRGEKLRKGEVIKLDIGLWQTGIQFEAGEQLVLKISGHPMALAEFPNLQGAVPNGNKGKHHVHYGGGVASHLIIPVVNV
jgi:predicted acyl esterase